MHHMETRKYLAAHLEHAGIRTARYHGLPQRKSCHLLHQDNPQRRPRGGTVPDCHPNWGRGERDFADGGQCSLWPAMPDTATWVHPTDPGAARETVDTDHQDTWYRDKRMVAKVWYPYTLPLGALGDAHTRAARLGLTLTVHVGWGIHYFGATPAVILSLADAWIPDPPLPEDIHTKPGAKASAPAPASPPTVRPAPAPGSWPGARTTAQ